MQPRIIGTNNSFFTKITISSANFPTNSDIEIPIKWPGGWSLVNEGTGVIQYSVNGTYVAGDLTAATPSAALTFYNRPVAALWFRLASGSASILRIEAWQ